MSKPSESSQVDSWDQVGESVQSPSPTYRSSGDGRLVSVSVPCSGLSVGSLLYQARGQERFFWEDVRDGIVYAGFGLAVNLLAWGDQRFAHMHEQARALFADAVIEGTLRVPAPACWRRRVFLAASRSAQTSRLTTRGQSSIRRTLYCPITSLYSRMRPVGLP